MSKNKVRFYREKLGYTQFVLAKQTNLSLRTIQRVESGHTTPKGHTLNELARVLEVERSELLEERLSNKSVDKEDKLNIAMINLAALSFIGIPFGNLVLPVILWRKKRTSILVDEAGRRIINFQIIWSMSLSILLIISPFIQKALSPSFSLILFVGIVATCLNIFVIGKTAISINKNNINFLDFQMRFL